ncbi:MAG: hypothetical protein WA103_03390 [Minisyncoccales bacterium]
MKNIKCDILVFVVAALAVGGFAVLAFAGASHNVGGFAWSENIGWVSFNSSDPGAGGADYGVNIAESTGFMSGYARSENIGWVSFNVADAAGCGGCSGGGCQAKVSLASNASGQHEISGWAKVLANGGGWDGCVSLRGSNYGVSIDPVTGDFHGWAWSDMVLGWLSFNGTDPGAGNKPYKVHTSAKFGPIAKMGCNNDSCPDGYCDAFDDSIWEAWTPNGDCVSCVYKVNNLSSGVVNCTKWELVGTPYVYASGGKVDHTFQPNVPASEVPYTLKLTVSDEAYSEANPDCAAGNSSSVEHKIIIRQNVTADFQCSLSDPNIYDEDGVPIGINDSVFENCTSGLDKTNFEKRIVKDGTFWVKDASSPSAAGLGLGLSYDWRFTINSGLASQRIENSNDVISSFVAGKTNKVEIYVTDNVGKMNCKIVDYKARSLPKWEEIPI